MGHLCSPWNSHELKKNLSTFYTLSPSISPTMTVTLLLYITSQTPFSLSPLTKKVSANSTPLVFHNVRVITVSNSASRDFPALLPTRHFFAFLHCFTITILHPWETVKWNLFFCLMHHKLFLADDKYQIISRDPNIQMKNDSGAAGFSISTLSCQACLVSPSCKSKLSFSQGDLELVPDTDFCKNNREPLLARIKLTPTLDQILKKVPNVAHKFHTYYC